jgi:methyl-accepting chemotaxis protein
VIAFIVVLFGPVAKDLADTSVSVAQREIAAHQMLALHDRIWFAIPVLIALCLAHSILVSHRIAGPLVRFKQVFGSVANGDLSTAVTIRRHDYLHDEALGMRAMLSNLEERVCSIKEGYRRASGTLPGLMDAVARGAQDEVAVLAGKLGTEMDALGETISALRVRDDGTPEDPPERVPEREPVEAH